MGQTNPPIGVYLKLAQEALAVDPHDPSTCRNLLAVFYQQQNWAGALEMALQLESLYKKMHPRTLYCLKQYPEGQDRVTAGFDFAGEMRQVAQQLKQRLGQA